MVEIDNPSEEIQNVHLESTAYFLAAVSALAVLLLVIFIFVNKKWRIFNVGIQPKNPHHQPISKPQFKNHPVGESHGISGSDSSEELQIRYQGQNFSHPQTISNIPGSNPYKEYKPLSTIDQNCIPEEEYNYTQHYYHQPSHSHHHLLQQQRSIDLHSLPSYTSNNVGNNFNSSRDHHHLRSGDLRDRDIYLSHSSGTPTTSASTSSTTAHSSTASVNPNVNYSNLNSGPQQVPAVASSSQQAYASQGGGGQNPLRPLRVTSIRDVDDVSVASSRRRYHKGSLRKQSSGGSSGLGLSGKGLRKVSTDGNSDIMSLAEKGKVGGGSSASSTSSNSISAEEDHRNHMLQNISQGGIGSIGSVNPHGRHQRTNSVVSLRSNPVVPLPRNPAGPNSTSSDRSSNPPPSSGSGNPHFRRMMMPPRTTSMESESPPPSEQGLSTYGDSLADQDQDHIFEVEEDMSLVEGDLMGNSSRVVNSLQAAGSFEVSFDYEAAVRKLTCHIIQARGIPPKDIGGASQVQIRLVLLPSRRQKYKTKVRPGENPQFMESFVFNKINPEEVSSLGIRFRLYGCERLRREKLLGETLLEFGSLHLELDTTLWLNFEPRYHLSLDSRSETSLARSDSASSTNSIQNGGIPEMLLGLSYNGTTGRLTAEIIKGSHFRNLAGGRAPDSYIKLVLLNCNGQEMGRTKTSLRRAQSNPLFKETFMFQVSMFQIQEVTLLVSVYGRKGVTKRELLGWFSLGYNSSSDEETTHWEDTQDACGDQISRWHVLIQS